ncbi:hypothetical protein SGLAM104S_00529 [Streptomyces glaucescens]
MKAAVKAVLAGGGPAKLVLRLLTDADFLAAHAEGILSADEQKTILWAKPVRGVKSAKWSPADAVLIDEAGTLGRGAYLVRADGRCGGLTGAVAFGRAGRGRLHGAGEPARDRLLDAGRELVGLGQLLVGEEFGQPAGVPLTDGAHLPGALPRVKLLGRRRRTRPPDR